MLLQVCLNGARDVAQHPSLSTDASMVGEEAARAIAAGAREIHVHPKDETGRDSVAADDVARWVRAVREACPGVSIGVTTGAWSETDPGLRHAAVAGWTELPDYASVNWHETGSDELAELLLSRGIGVEAGVWDGVGLEAWRRSPVRGGCLRVLIELPDETASGVRAHADALLAGVAREEPDLPVLLHGEERSAWPALDLAAERGLDTRIGLEDTLVLPDGLPAPDNAALVRAAVDRMRASRAS